MQLPEAEFFLFPKAFNNIIMNKFSYFPIGKVYLSQRKKKETVKEKKSYGDINKREKII